jgi:hypothetical protein
MHHAHPYVKNCAKIAHKLSHGKYVLPNSLFEHIDQINKNPQEHSSSQLSPTDPNKIKLTKFKHVVPNSEPTTQPINQPINSAPNSVNNDTNYDQYDPNNSDNLIAIAINEIENQRNLAKKNTGHKLKNNEHVVTNDAKPNPSSSVNNIQVVNPTAAIVNKSNNQQTSNNGVNNIDIDAILPPNKNGNDQKQSDKIQINNSQDD